MNAPPVKLRQMELVIDIIKAIEKQHPKIGVDSRMMNAIVFGANHIVKEFAREPVAASANMGLEAWLKSDDTGMSSMFMAHVLCGIGMSIARGCDQKPHPYDNSDFGRCHRFLKAVDHESLWKQHMAEQSPQWAALVARWDELTDLYEHDPYSVALYNAIQDCIK